jgi:hypothetical protein
MCAVCTQKLMIGFDAEPTVVVYHKTGKHPNVFWTIILTTWMYVVYDVVWIVKATVEPTICCWHRRYRARMTYVPVAVYSHDKYRWIYDKPSIPVRFVRPRRTEKKDTSIRIPYSTYIRSGCNHDKYSIRERMGRLIGTRRTIRGK